MDSNLTLIFTVFGLILTICSWFINVNQTFFLNLKTEIFKQKKDALETIVNEVEKTKIEIQYVVSIINSYLTFQKSERLDKRILEIRSFFEKKEMPLIYNMEWATKFTGNEFYFPGLKKVITDIFKIQNKLSDEMTDIMVKVYNASANKEELNHFKELMSEFGLLISLIEPALKEYWLLPFKKLKEASGSANQNGIHLSTYSVVEFMPYIQRNKHLKGYLIFKEDSLLKSYLDD